MKITLLKYLWCLSCHSELNLVATEGNAEIENGELICSKCGEKYPIVRGIPRFVETGDYTESFGYEWNKLNWLREEDEQEFFTITDLKRDDLRGKVVLDAGCGGGRIARFASNYCSEFIGFDYSNSVDKAYELCKNNSNTNFVQCDVNRHPFRPGFFDIVISHGVLHHTPNTKKSFDNLPSLVKQGGVLYVAVFGKCFILFSLFDDCCRFILNKLSYKMIAKVCRGLTNAGYFVYAVFKKFLWFSLPKSRYLMVYALFDWYSPKYHHRHSVCEVKKWFEEAGLKDVKYINAYPYSSLEEKYKDPSFWQTFHLWGSFLGVIGVKR